MEVGCMGLSLLQLSKNKGSNGRATMNKLMELNQPLQKSKVGMSSSPRVFYYGQKVPSKMRSRFSLKR